MNERLKCCFIMYGMEHKLLFYIILYNSQPSCRSPPEKILRGAAPNCEVMPATARTLQKNRLIAGLQRPNALRLKPYLENVELSFGQVLHEPDAPIQHVYFPHDCVVSLLGVDGSNKAAEVAVVANEGVVGGATAFGLGISQFRSLVRVAGSATRIAASRMRKEFEEHGSWNPALHHFTHALMGQIAQTAICNRFHTVEARLARWLLATRDRAASHDFHVTQEFLAYLLGVRRVGVTAAASSLQDRGLIAYSRGNMRLLNPAALERSACACYPASKAVAVPRQRTGG